MVQLFPLQPHDRALPRGPLPCSRGTWRAFTRPSRSTAGSSTTKGKLTIWDDPGGSWSAANGLRNGGLDDGEYADGARLTPAAGIVIPAKQARRQGAMTCRGDRRSTPEMACIHARKRESQPTAKRTRRFVTVFVRHHTTYPPSLLSQVELPGVVPRDLAYDCLVHTRHFTARRSGAKAATPNHRGDSPKPTTPCPSPTRPAASAPPRLPGTSRTLAACSIRTASS